MITSKYQSPDLLLKGVKKVFLAYEMPCTIHGNELRAQL